MDGREDARKESPASPSGAGVVVAAGRGEEEITGGVGFAGDIARDSEVHAGGLVERVDGAEGGAVAVAPGFQGVRGLAGGLPVDCEGSGVEVVGGLNDVVTAQKHDAFEGAAPGTGSGGHVGEHLEAFFGCLYYASTQPSEAAALGDTGCLLPDEEDEDAWGELVLSESRPEVGSGWTDDGQPYEKRGLKRRARKATRSVPIPPVLVRMFREHIRTYGTAPDGRLFRAVGGGRVRSTEYTEMWQAARGKVAGVDPVEAARRAGHSAAVLFRFYARRSFAACRTGPTS
ncbi:hypothetical protein [Streptomyces sp. NPDC088910]|uniref:hypothetical protein n=1 Tax=Streptomyces sp. NPDC088910 TaxID=3365911 RepID=UPI0038298FE3